MKNYVDETYLKDKFIKKFVIKCNNIIVYFSNGKKKNIAFNNENISMLDKEMSEQISKYALSKYNKCIGGFYILGFFLLLLLSFFNIIIFKVGFSSKLLLFVLGILTDLGLIVENNIIFKDVKKNMLFIKEREFINKLTEDIPLEIEMDKLNIKGYDVVNDYDNSIKEDHLLVNDIDNMSYMDVKRLVSLSYNNFLNKSCTAKIKKLVRKNND